MMEFEHNMIVNDIGKIFVIERGDNVDKVMIAPNDFEREFDPATAEEILSSGIRKDTIPESSQFEIYKSNVYNADELFLPFPNYNQKVLIFKCMEITSVKPLYLFGKFVDFKYTNSEVEFRFELKTPYNESREPSAENTITHVTRIKYHILSALMMKVMNYPV